MIVSPIGEPAAAHLIEDKYHIHPYIIYFMRRFRVMSRVAYRAVTSPPEYVLEWDHFHESPLLFTLQGR